MMWNNTMKRVALAGFLATAWSLPASAQDAAQIQADQSQPQLLQGLITLTNEAEVEAAPGQSASGAQPAPPVTVKAETMRWEFQTPSPYWIGVEALPLDAPMRLALDLSEKHGILVALVTDDSPAAKAGLQAGDILLQWGDTEKKFQPIESVEHLVKLIQDAAAKQPEQAVTIEYRRRGKTETVELKPAKRAGAQTLTLNMGNLGSNEHARHQQSAMQQQLKLLEQQRDEAKKRLEVAGAKTSRSGPVDKNAAANFAKAEIQYKLLEAQVQQAEAQLRQFEVWAKAMQAHGFQLPGQANANFDVLIPAPGIVTKATGPFNAQAIIQGHAQMKAAEWPEDLSVTMTRRGNKPAQFVVERGENKWQVTAETLKDLPPEVRVLVEPLAEPQRSRMMRLWSSSGDDAPGRVELRVPEGERVPVPGLPIAPPRVVIHATPQLQPIQVPPATQKQIDDLQKALDQLRKQVELMEKK